MFFQDFQTTQMFGQDGMILTKKEPLGIWTLVAWIFRGQTGEWLKVGDQNLMEAVIRTVWLLKVMTSAGMMFPVMLNIYHYAMWFIHHESENMIALSSERAWNLTDQKCKRSVMEFHEFVWLNYEMNSTNKLFGTSIVLSLIFNQSLLSLQSWALNFSLKPTLLSDRLHLIIEI